MLTEIGVPTANGFSTAPSSAAKRCQPTRLDARRGLERLEGIPLVAMMVRIATHSSLLPRCSLVPPWFRDGVPSEERDAGTAVGPAARVSSAVLRPAGCG